MKFVIDENVPLGVATALRSLGHDCLAIAQIDPRSSDDAILARAREEERVVVTFDADFGRMIFHELQPPPPGVVYMRGRPEQALLVSKIFLTLFTSGQLAVMGRFVVIEPGGEIRTLPLGS
ncbi:DUF5615 family PIN-like protein [uncultured Sphingomonas sp.]|uniref:DUF5615 family PIN-like protein n=1 Tax=uncultured Sphingomonas sp. TaxID=158754 RepID=UPI0035CB9657